jgi:TPR repeat protein
MNTTLLSLATVAALATATAACAPDIGAAGLVAPGGAYDQQACVETALRRGPDPEAARDALAEMTQGCALGDSASCSMLGVIYELGRGVRPDTRYARDLYRKACGKGNARACGNLGELELKEGGAPDSAKSLLRTSCDAGHGRACTALGRVYADEGVPGSRALFQLACNRGEAAGCVALADQLERAGEPTSSPAVLELLLNACGRGEAEACSRLSNAARSRPAPASRSVAVAGASPR